jgi:plasmid stabilization system protein ParE
MKLIYTAEAIGDLQRLRAFIAEHDPKAAQRVGAELVTRIEAIAAFSRMGQRVERAPDPELIRDFAFGKYVVRYVVHAQVVAILRIWHHLEDRG